jgi:hypothetical protein
MSEARGRQTKVHFAGSFSSSGSVKASWRLAISARIFDSIAGSIGDAV